MVGAVPVASEGRDRRTAGDEGVDAGDPDVRGYPIGDDRIDRRRRHDVRNVLDRQIGRAQHEALRHAIELDERERRRELIGRREEHRAPAELVVAITEARPQRQIA